jgi:hypothetical protein
MNRVFDKQQRHQQQQLQHHQQQQTNNNRTADEFTTLSDEELFLPNLNEVCFHSFRFTPLDIFTQRNYDVDISTFQAFPVDFDLNACKEENVTCDAQLSAVGSSINEVTVLGGLSQEFYDCSSKP